MEAEEYFHNPYDEQTEEQIEYQKEMLSHHSGSRGRAEFEAEEEAHGERGSGGSGKSGDHLGATVKGIFQQIRAGGKALKDYVSLEHQMDKDLKDKELFPKVDETAFVRRGGALSPDEQAFLADRKLHVRDHFARYMGWDPAHVHPDDVPTVAFGGSGGGYRAMLAVLGYSLAMKQAGLWDLLSYVTGVSGSCWAIAAYYTFGNGSFEAVIEHCKKRLSPHHPLSPDAVEKLLSSYRGDYQTLGPLVVKKKSGLHNVPMDLYAVFTTGYLFMQPDPMLKPLGHAEAEIPGWHKSWWKWTDAQTHLSNGKNPLPIMTAIRHERPWKDWADDDHPFEDVNPQSKEHAEAKDAWFQWFELSPFEIGCDEPGLQAWVPTWGFGRPFEGGRSVKGLPEQSLSLLIGLCVSAPAGPLSSYLATIQRNIPHGFLGDAINKLSTEVAKMWGKQGTAIFENHHPLHACNEFNYLYRYTPMPEGTRRPPGLENSPRIHLVDSGMDNNCPTYVMLRPERNVDVILNMDASSDVQKDSFQQRVQQIGSRRGLDFRRRQDIKPDPDTSNPDRFKGLYAQVYDGVISKRPHEVVDSYGRTVKNPPADVCRRDCTMVYLPLLPNERAVPGYDPSTAKFSGSYNLVWTPEQIDMIIKTSIANFNDGQDTIREALFNAWQRRKFLREQGREQGLTPQEGGVSPPPPYSAGPSQPLYQVQPGYQPKPPYQPQPPYNPQDSYQTEPQGPYQSEPQGSSSSSSSSYQPQYPTQPQYASQSSQYPPAQPQGSSSYQSQYPAQPHYASQSQPQSQYPEQTQYPGQPHWHPRPPPQGPPPQ